MFPHPDGTDQLIQVRPDVRLHVVSVGAAESTPVIMLHGYPEFWWSWRFQLRFLPECHFRAIAPDLRGVNHSDKPDRGYDPATLAEDIIRLMDVLGHPTAVIMGDDYGGFVAYVMALLFPTRVEKLIIFNTLHPGRWADLGKPGSKRIRVAATLAEWGHQVFTPAIEQANQVIGIGRMMLWMAHNKLAFPFSVRTTHSNAYQRSAKTATSYVPHAARWLRDVHLPDLVIKQPTLVLWPAHDFAAPVWITRTLTETVPNAQLEIVPGAGHWPHQENPEFVNREILKFLGK